MPVSEKESLEALQQALQQNNGRYAELVSPHGEMSTLGWVQVKEGYVAITNKSGELRTVASMDDVHAAMEELGMPTNLPFWR